MGPEMEGSEEWQEVWPEPRAGALLEVLARRLNLSPRAVRSPEKDLVRGGAALQACQPERAGTSGKADACGALCHRRALSTSSLSC